MYASEMQVTLSNFGLEVFILVYSCTKYIEATATVPGEPG